MTPCVFCGEVPQVLPHWCLIEKRQREEQALYELALVEARAAVENDAMNRAMSRVLWLERNYNDSIARMERLERERNETR